MKAFCGFTDHPYDKAIGTTAKAGKKKYVHLPASDDTWRVYPMDVKPIKGNEKAFLRPSKFGGLTYEILGSTQAHIYLIQTRDFGKVQIYAHLGTGATFTSS